MIAATGITRWEQLKGKRIAISRFGSGTDTAVRLVLEKFGLNPDKDATILQLGPQTTRFSALVSGSTDATLVAPPFDVTAKSRAIRSWRIWRPSESLTPSRSSRPRIA